MASSRLGEGRAAGENADSWKQELAMCRARSWWGNAMKSTEEQRCLCLKPGTHSKMKEAEQVLRDTDCLSKEWQNNHDCIPGMSLTSPVINKNIPFTPAGMMLAVARGVLAVPAADGFCSLTEQEVMLFLSCF